MGWSLFACEKRRRGKGVGKSVMGACIADMGAGGGEVETGR